MNRISAFICLICALLAGCIRNDLPYPRITQSILAIAAEGELKSAYIDSIAFEATVYLEETVDIQNVRFTEYKISEDGTSDPNLLEGTYDLTQPLFVTLSRFQEYNWEVKAVQDIERYFDVEGQIGQSLIDPVGHRVIVDMPEGTDLEHLTLLRAKLGPKGITTISPALEAGPLDLSYPLRVSVECFGRSEYWTIYAQISELVVSTTAVDAWSQVIWCYGSGPADVKNSFQYKESGSSEWVTLPESDITQTQGEFSACIPHLTPLTEYTVRAISGENFGNEIKVTTQSTADIPDGDFENWSMSGKMWVPWAEGGTPYWDSGNKGSVTLGVNLTVPSDHTPTGSGKAAECSTKFVGIGKLGKLGAGSIYTGSFLRLDGTNGVLGFGRPWDLRPTVLKGYFQYNGVTIDESGTDVAYIKAMIGQPDTCHIYVALLDWTAPYEIRTNPNNRHLFDKNSESVIGYGELQFAGQMDSYKEFNIPITYRSTSRVPTYLQITCSTSKYGDYFTGGNGSVLYVDQLSFSYDLSSPAAIRRAVKKKKR